jgi:hypothetical protein
LGAKWPLEREYLFERDNFEVSLSCMEQLGIMH